MKLSTGIQRTFVSWTYFTGRRKISIGLLLVTEGKGMELETII
jgi:hypothetical protein